MSNWKIHYTLQQSNIAMENGPFVNDFPNDFPVKSRIQFGDFPARHVADYQRVNGHVQ